MYTLVIFDLDGTLLDTLDDLSNSMNHALKTHNLPTHSPLAYRKFIGNGVSKLIERALPSDRKDAETIATIKLEFLKHYYMHSDALTKPYDGIPELLQQLSDAGLKMAIASNKVHQATVDLAHRFFPKIPFIEVLGQREGIPTKPDATILHEIIAKAGVKPHEVMYVGDSGVDAQTARNAGVDFSGVLWGFRSAEELTEQGAKVLINKPSELLKRCLSN